MSAEIPGARTSRDGGDSCRQARKDALSVKRGGLLPGWSLTCFGAGLSKGSTPNSPVDAPPELTPGDNLLPGLAEAGLRSETKGPRSREPHNLGKFVCAPQSFEFLELSLPVGRAG